MDNNGHDRGGNVGPEGEPLFQVAPKDALALSHGHGLHHLFTFIFTFTFNTLYNIAFVSGGRPRRGRCMLHQPPCSNCLPCTGGLADLGGVGGVGGLGAQVGQEHREQ